MSWGEQGQGGTVHPWAGGTARQELCRAGAGQEVGSVIGRGRQMKSCLGRLKAVAVFVSVSQIAFLPAELPPRVWGTPSLAAGPPPMPGEKRGHLRKALQAGSLVPWESSCPGRQGRCRSPAARQGNLRYYVVPLAGSESQDAVRRYYTGRRDEGKGLLTHVPAGFVSPPLTKRP